VLSRVHEVRLHLKYFEEVVYGIYDFILKSPIPHETSFLKTQIRI